MNTRVKTAVPSYLKPMSPMKKKMIKLQFTIGAAIKKAKLQTGLDKDSKNSSSISYFKSPPGSMSGGGFSLKAIFRFLETKKENTEFCEKAFILLDIMTAPKMDILDKLNSLEVFFPGILNEALNKSKPGLYKNEEEIYEIIENSLLVLLQPVFDMLDDKCKDTAKKAVKRYESDDKSARKFIKNIIKN